MSTVNEKIAADDSIIAWADSGTLYEGGYPQLHVPKGCGAAIILNGHIMEIKEEGKHDLTSENFPLSAAQTSVNEPSSGLKAMFYKTNIDNLKWGLSRVSLQDQGSTFFELKAFGSVDFQITDVKKTIENIIGFNPKLERMEFSLIAVNPLERDINEYISNECKKHFLKDKIRLSSAELNSKLLSSVNVRTKDMGYKIKQINIEEIALV